MNTKKLSIILIFFTIPSFAQSTPESLTAKLQEMADASKKKHPAERLKIMDDATEELRKSQILSKALKVGDKMPDFVLKDAKSKKVSSKDLLKKGPLVVTFYRGAWCPYCNVQLDSLQKSHEEFKALGAEVVAISPQTPDNSLTSVEKNNLKIIVLSDPASKVGKSFGLVFTLPNELKKLYSEMGLDLEKFNGQKNWELPLAATYIVNKEGKVTYAFVDVDYKKRAETSELLSELKKL